MMPNPTPTTAARVRDVRLDFFRGVCLFIIFVAHIFDNPWALLIPARFGLSDAAEIFVFLSGMASAVAFASVFVKRGFFMGTARILHRVWQVYWAHVSVFLICTVVMVLIDRYLDTGEDYIRGLMMEPFFNEHARDALVGLFTLTYVPPFFDILPMYLVILAMVPVVMLLAGFNKWYAMAAIVATWFVASFGFFDLSREPWGTDKWFFNPFSWQLVFFTGFAFMRGWLPAPKADPRLIAAAVVYLLICLPLEWEPLRAAFPWLREATDWLHPVINKTHVGVFRFLHFLALAYLSFIAVGEAGHRLKGPVVRVVCKVGQQSLGIFLLTLVLSFTASALLNVLGRSFLMVALVNLGGMAIMVAVAYLNAWYKSVPWKAPPKGSRADQAAGFPVADPGAHKDGHEGSKQDARWPGRGASAVPAE
ncbi:MAG: OpgC domain-containing protein [Alphaproteobacteria bacterium]|nr:OpgC domain-containing protein [Alphaproteobacteria bacterium]